MDCFAVCMCCRLTYNWDFAHYLFWLCETEKCTQSSRSTWLLAIVCVMMSIYTGNTCESTYTIPLLYFDIIECRTHCSLKCD